MQSHVLGEKGERYAQALYQKRGYRIFGSNFFNRGGKRMGEIDFVAVSKQSIAFVEVKTRTQESSTFGSAAESITFRKKLRLLKTVKLFLLGRQDLANLAPRIDVCLIFWPNIDKKPEKVIILPSAIEDI